MLCFCRFAGLKFLKTLASLYGDEMETNLIKYIVSNNGMYFLFNINLFLTTKTDVICRKFVLLPGIDYKRVSLFTESEEAVKQHKLEAVCALSLVDRFQPLLAEQVSYLLPSHSQLVVSCLR